ncbi:CBS domain protein [Streptomyces sp. ADI95-16]|uniref:CBS domain-containing protein n=1 Tax=Streptomyces sp. ADI95-16 TaxID=1522758 RepID=UPI000F431A5B|nr:CBS domain-containing protein [Streptomyces sp. ADI95-16]AYV25342.1 CBS domain protein [Streptomyces sp. ADI95-16]
MTSTPYTVNDVMTKTVVTVTSAAEFKEIAAAMERWKVTAVPVIEGEGHVVGGRRLGDTAKAGSVRAEQLMTSPAVTISPDTTLPQAARLDDVPAYYTRMGPANAAGPAPGTSHGPRSPTCPPWTPTSTGSCWTCGGTPNAQRAGSKTRCTSRSTSSTDASAKCRPGWCASTARGGMRAGVAACLLDAARSAGLPMATGPRSDS